ncbi:DNA polymerase III subunit delta [Desulfogranum mediterraneum]|uniref:DNA polymerase III subunit delta n=1 Tax=Desulfogranum mediterraneum TaxID=160661 RepID=UPI000429BFE2|nr:hypothetical protein [Desulfogranum mediterraneum]
MPVHTRDSLAALLEGTEPLQSQVFLVFGERFLCQDAVKKLEQRLIQPSGTVHPIDGEQEEITTLVSKLQSYSLLPGRQVYRVSDTRIFHSKAIAENIWNRAVKAHAANKAKQLSQALRNFLQIGQLEQPDPPNLLVELSAAEWQRLFAFTKPGEDLSWTTPVLAAMGSFAAKPPQQDPVALLSDCLQHKLPAATTLILVCEEVDKRKKFYKFLKEHHTIIDLSVEGGASAKAQKSQKAVLLGLIRETLQTHGKSMAPQVGERLMERVGFHPVAVVMELEKVILSLGERRQVEAEDLDALVGRTRQEAIFELTTALTQQNPGQLLAIAERLQAGGIHPLALIATLRNLTRSLLLFRALQDQPRYGYSPSMSAQVFQQQCLPLLKEEETWKKELAGHPYALYMQFKTAARYSSRQLQQWMRLLLQAELRLKGSPVSAQTVLQHLLISMLSRQE